MTLRSAKAHAGKQMDIRNMFGKKGKKESSADEKDVLKRYKAEFTTIFGLVTTAGKNALIPPFLPLDEKALQNTTE